MTFSRLVISITAWAFCLLALELHDVVGPVEPRQVEIQWAQAVPAGERARLERELHLGAGTPVDDRTWTYPLTNRSRGNIERIVRERLVQGTRYIDRENFRLIPDLTGEPPWIRAIAETSLFQQWDRRLTTLALAGAVVGTVALWPLLRRVSVGIQRRARAGGARLRAEAVELRGSLPGREASIVLGAILVVSMSLRIVLVFSGGQLYWEDEGRYRQARETASRLGTDAVPLMLERMSHGEHPLFGALSVIPAAIERIAGASIRIPGLFFAMFSVLNIGLLALIAKRTGASDSEAVMAATLLALCASFFYYARHLLPYDAAMFFGLMALYFGTGDRTRPAFSILAGVCAACAFLTYSGYWTLGGAALIIHVLGAGDRTAAVRRALLAATGLLAPLLAMVAVTWLAGGNLIAAILDFSRSIDQGAFSEGWRLPWEYLWHAEHVTLLLLLLATVWALSRVFTRSVPSAAGVALLGIALTYVSLVLFSTVLDRFVVYGRLARQLVPFLCLAGATAIRELQIRLPSRMRAVATTAIVLVLIAQASINFAEPLAQIFPNDFARDLPADAAIPADASVRAINARHFYPGPEPVTLPARYIVLKEARHPLQFLPYQYEGYTPEQRAALRSSDLTMRLIVVLPALPRP
jgi:hypothetical protein